MKSEPLRPDHGLALFDCGNEVLNDWLTRLANRAQESGTARTVVWVEDGSSAVVAYYSLSATQVTRDEVGAKLAGGVSLIPAFLLARLALHRDLQGQCLGGELLHDALDTVVRGADRVGARLVIVDAIDDAAVRFYARHDFAPVRSDLRRLVMKVATARKAIGLGTLRVSGDRQTRLTSMLLTGPDGRESPALVSPEEAGRISRRLQAELDEMPTTGTISLTAVLLDELGRDPFVE